MHETADVRAATDKVNTAKAAAKKEFSGNSE